MDAPEGNGSEEAETGWVTADPSTLTAVEFAALLRIDKTTLSKWENDEDPIGEQSDRLIRLVVLELGEGLKEEMVRLKETPADWIRGFPKIAKTSKKVALEVDPEKMIYKVA